MSAAPPPPPPPPPMPGTPGAMKLPSYRDQQEQMRQQSPSTNSIQEQQYANLPAKLMTAMNKDKKPFTYTLGGIGEGGILDLSEIKSPRMKKRIQANLRGIEESGNEIKTPPTPDLLTNLDEENSSDRISSPMTFKLPPPPPKTIQSLENASAYASPSSPCGVRSLPITFNNQPSSTQLNGAYNDAFDEQLSNLCSGLNLKTDFNNNINSNNSNSNMNKLYSFNNYNSSPKPFTPTSSPFTSTPFESKVPVTFNKVQHQSSLDEAIDTGRFPRPPPPQVPLIANSPGSGVSSLSTVSPASPPVMNPPVMYAPNVQEQWLARKQQQLPPESELMTGKRCSYNASYDEKMRKIREANTENLPPNPISAYMPTLQEKWLQRKQEQQAQQNQQASHGGVIAKGQSSPNIQPTWTNLHEEEHDRSAPIQSRTFKVLQKLTEGMEDELEAFKIEQEKNDARQRQQVRQQQQQPASSNLWARSSSPVRAKSPVVPNPPIAYAPTLQEQWMMRKQQQQQQQQPQMKVNREVTFAPSTFNGASSSNYMNSPQVSYPNQVVNSIQNTNRSGEIIIPVQIERSDGRKNNEEPASPRYTGASFPSRSFQALRMMTGEEAFPSFPSSNFFTPMESQFISPTGFVGGATGIQGTDF